MIKNTIIRIDDHNLIMLEIDPEEHTGQGGIMDTETETFYPFNSVVNPTKSSIVRFDDTNVVLIKLDPDTHDSSAIIMDEVSGNVYPIGGGGGHNPPEDYRVRYQGNYTTGTTDMTIVTLITLPVDIESDQTFIITPDTGYEIFPVTAYGNGNNVRYDPAGNNRMYIYATTWSGYDYTRTDNIIDNNNQSNTVLQFQKPISQWYAETIIYINKETEAVTFFGIPFFIRKTNGDDLTPDDAIEHVTWRIS